MRSYKLKRTVVGLILALLTLGYAFVGVAAANPDRMEPPQGEQRGRMPGGFGGQRPDGEAPDFDGQFPDGEAPDFEGEAPDGERPDFDGGFPGGGRRGFGDPRGHGRGGYDPMMLREQIEALEDETLKAELLSLLDKVDAAMQTAQEADDDSREAAQAALEEARQALEAALQEAGIDLGMGRGEGMTPPEKPEGDDDRTPPERPEGGQPPEMPTENAGQL